MLIRLLKSVFELKNRRSTAGWYFVKPCSHSRCILYTWMSYQLVQMTCASALCYKIITSSRLQEKSSKSWSLIDVFNVCQQLSFFLVIFDHMKKQCLLTR